jgi:coiled-coil domain-containing protein 12
MGDRDDEDGDATTTTTEGLALEPNVGDVDPSMLAPRRANWDLKRDVEPKLEKLERRTQRALVDIAREEERKRAAA